MLPARAAQEVDEDGVSNVPGATRPGTRCRRTNCLQVFSAHVGGKCPGLDGQDFQPRRHTGASQSFAEAEVAVLDSLLKHVLAGEYQSARAVLRSPGGNGVMRKVQSMRESLKRRRANGIRV